MKNYVAFVLTLFTGDKGDDVKYIMTTHVNGNDVEGAYERLLTDQRWLHMRDKSERSMIQGLYGDVINNREELLADTTLKAPRAEWLCPVDYPPPRGNKIQILTMGGVSIVGNWSDDGCAAWMPLPNTPAKIKQRMMLWATGRKDEIGV